MKSTDPAIKSIPDSYCRNIYGYSKVTRQDNVVIYRQTSRESGQIIGYEVCLIRNRSADNELTGAKAGDEYLPGPEDWGKYGWTCLNLESAMERFNKLLLRKNEPRTD